jgi:hypothetical protein
VGAPRGTIAERLARHTSKTEACWVWTGFCAYGYGRIRVGGRSRPAHIIAWEEVNGPVPEGFELDHLCRNHSCVRPDHLEAVTHQENVLRGESFAAKHSRVTACPSGHRYDKANTYRRNGQRFCRACNRERAKLNYYAIRPALGSVPGVPQADVPNG